MDLPNPAIQGILVANLYKITSQDAVVPPAKTHKKLEEK